MIMGIPKDIPPEKKAELMIRMSLANADIPEERMKKIIKEALANPAVQDSIKKDLENQENG